MSQENKNPSRTLYMAQGKLIVENTRGYWFTAGGDKGSFGYYPHLKTIKKGVICPVFPDTQIHGDLRMAAEWLCRTDQSYDKKLVSEIFGKADGVQSSKFKTSDLELKEPEQWQPERFDVKTRSEIDDSTRTNVDHMLADIEWSFLDGLDLESSIYLGYFDDPDRLENAQQLINDALDLLSGFGASRSRGAGRGRIIIEWENTDSKSFVQPQPPSNATAYETFHYVLTPLVHVRNKQINPGSAQLLRSAAFISSRQLNAWFARAFNQIFSPAWPTPEQMSLVSFSTAYPAFKDDKSVLPAFPAPGTTLSFEDGRIEDVYGKQGGTNDENDQENYVRSKAKPLSEGMFLTNSNSPSIVAISSERRMRNSMDEKFITLDEGGLFVQELIHRDQPFYASVSINRQKDSDFCAKAQSILENMYPDIGGAFFSPELKKNPVLSSSIKDTSEPVHKTVSEPIEFKPEWLTKTNRCQARIGVIRTYNTSLKRPRRNRIVFLPGSILPPADDSRMTAWLGFNTSIREKTSQPAEVPPNNETKNHVGQIASDIKKISPSQAGILREMTLMKAQVAAQKIDAILKKYESWEKQKIEDHLIPKDMLESLQSLLKDKEKGKELFNGRIHEICAKASENKWRGEKDSLKKKLEDEKAKFFGGENKTRGMSS